MARRWLRYLAFVFLIIFLVAFSIVSFDLYRLFYLPMMPGNDAARIVRLDKSTTATSFVRSLTAQHLVKSEAVLLLLMRIQGLSSQLKAGVYQINARESAMQFLHRVAAGDALTESFRIIEGTSLQKISADLAIAPYLTYQKEDWLLIAPTYAQAEGQLLADTYHYKAGTKSTSLLNLAHSHLQTYLDYSWQNRAENLPYKTRYELLIVASIVEKESALASEKRLIAGVIINRLRKKMPLQMDPTVIYALGSAYKGRLSHQDLYVVSPYNTYRNRGLPPTPIAMVGRDAIDAAAHPTQTDFLYFVARGDGSHQFSVTYEQQKQAIARFMRKSD